VSSGGVGNYGKTVSACPPSREVSFEAVLFAKSARQPLALGIARKEEFFLAKAKGIGIRHLRRAKTGRDGIHGASLLASAEFTEESQQKRPNVQVGDPFVEKTFARGLPRSDAYWCSRRHSGHGPPASPAPHGNGVARGTGNEMISPEFPSAKPA